MTGDGHKDDSQNPAALSAITDAVAEYGSSRSVNIIREAAMRILGRRLEVQRERAVQLQERVDAMACQIKELEEELLLCRREIEELRGNNEQNSDEV